MPLFEIKNRWSGSVLFSLECGSMKVCLEAAVAAKANLRGSDLSGSDLRGSDLRGSDLRGSDLRGSNLSGSDLQPIRDDFFAVLSQAPAEVSSLIEALELGRINGSTYSDGECGCLVGTLAIASGIDPQQRSRCEAVHGLHGNGSRPAERFFLSIRRGDKPENNQFAKLAHEWATDWLNRMQLAFASPSQEAESVA